MSVKIDLNILSRTALSLALGGAAVGLFVMQEPAHVLQPPHPIPAPIIQTDWKTVLPKIDQAIDTLLAHAGIDKSLYRKKEFHIIESRLSRIERRIELPADVMPVELNHVLNVLVQRFEGRAIASENSKDHLITIHVQVQGYIVQTLILHPNASLKKGGVMKFPPSKA